MNHNPHNLKIGDIVILDNKYNNSSEVKIINFTPNKMFALIGDPDDLNDPWEVMTYRLTPKTNKT